MSDSERAAIMAALPARLKTLTSKKDSALR
jgi:predicted Fe-S protein YdhL (DUF1289 family)